MCTGTNDNYKTVKGKIYAFHDTLDECYEATAWKVISTLYESLTFGDSDYLELKANSKT